MYSGDSRYRHLPILQLIQIDSENTRDKAVSCMFCDMRIEKCCKLSRCPHVNDEVDSWGRKIAGRRYVGDLILPVQHKTLIFSTCFLSILHIYFQSETMCEVSSINKQRWWKEAIVYQVSSQSYVTRDRRLIVVGTGVSVSYTHLTLPTKRIV